MFPADEMSSLETLKEESPFKTNPNILLNGSEDICLSVAQHKEN